MRPLISFYGGKQRLASKILPLIESIPHTVYVEPFAGGASLLFAKPKREVSNNTHYKEVINDTSDLLINLYRVAIEQREELELKLKGTLYSQAEHRKALYICKNPKGFDNLTKAWAYYVNIQMSFSNILNAGWRVCCYGQNEPSVWNNKLERLSEVLERIKSVCVGSEDALDCIKRFDSPQTCFYLDPPYPNAEQGHYSGYTVEDWRNLCNLLDSIHGSYVLSNYQQEIEPKSAQQKVQIRAYSSASSRGRVNAPKTRAATPSELGNQERTEILWICDRSENIRSELKEVLARYQNNRKEN